MLSKISEADLQWGLELSMSFRSTTLSTSHYAGRWAIPSEDQRNDLAVVNALGYAYACAPDSPEKEAQLLVAFEAFHGYLSKYLVMILRGTLPPVSSYAGKDAHEFLRTLAPRGSEPGTATMEATCKMLHLAFQGMTTEDVYDTLVFCFVRAARRYDPHYAEKTRQVCEVLCDLDPHFTVENVEDRVGFPCTGILRSLVRKGILSSITGKKKVVGYKLGPRWPAPKSFFESGPIGFVYVLQIWFRYFLNEFVIAQMAHLEAGGNVLQLVAPSCISPFFLSRFSRSASVIDLGLLDLARSLLDHVDDDC